MATTVHDPAPITNSNQVPAISPDWHSGPPPYPGWWPVCSIPTYPKLNILSFWDGESWSVACLTSEKANYAGMYGKYHPSPARIDFYWTERPAFWPEFAREYGKDFIAGAETAHQNKEQS